jgi:hypothetical protein
MFWKKELFFVVIVSEWWKVLIRTKCLVFSEYLTEQEEEKMIKSSLNASLMIILGI